MILPGNRSILKIAAAILISGILLQHCSRTSQMHSIPTQLEAPKFTLKRSYRLPLKIERRPVVSVIGVGDILLGARATMLINNHGVDYPFDSTRSVLEGGDITIGNLEAPFTKRGEPFDKKYTFRVNPDFSAGLKNAGFDVVNLANNHIFDYGPDGLFDTITTLDSTGIAFCGAGSNDSTASEPAVITIGTTRVAFIGFSMTFPAEFWAGKERPGTAFATQSLVKNAMQRARNKADYIVVSFHWGAELMTHPKQYQQDFAHMAIDLGADLVLGHHAHVLQGLEIYQNRLIAYGLGNFTFGSYSRHAKESIILKTYLGRDGALFSRVQPVSVYNVEVDFQPILLEGERQLESIRYLNEISNSLNGGRDIITPDGTIWISSPTEPSHQTESAF